MWNNQPLLARNRSAQRRRDDVIAQTRHDRFFGCYWVSIGMMLAGVGAATAAAHIKFNSDKKYAHYLDKVGYAAVGACITGLVVALLFGGPTLLDTFRPENMETVTPGKMQMVLTVRKNASKAPTSIKKVFGGSAYKLSRMFYFAADIGFFLVNFTSFALAVKGALKLEDDPDKANNLPRHMVPAIELTFNIIIMSNFLISLVRLHLAEPCNSIPLFDRVVCDTLIGSSFSAASFIGIGKGYILVLPDQPNWIMSMLVASGGLASVMIGITALTTKVTNLDFLSKALIHEWTPSQWITLLAFANNLLKMGRSMDEIQAPEAQRVYFELLQAGSEEGNEDATIDQYFNGLMRDLINAYGKLGTVLIWATMTKAEVMELFKFQCHEEGTLSS